MTSLPTDIEPVSSAFGEIDGSEGGSAMSVKLKVILTWAEVVASAVLIAVPAIRGIDSKIEAAKVEISLIRKEGD